MYNVSQNLHLCLPNVKKASLPFCQLGLPAHEQKIRVLDHLSSIFKALELGEIASIEMTTLPSGGNTSVRIDIFMRNWWPSFKTFFLQRTLDYYGAIMLDLESGYLYKEENYGSQHLYTPTDIWQWKVQLYYSSISRPTLRRC